MAESTSHQGQSAAEGELAVRLDSLEGERIAYVDLGKPNGVEFYESLKAILESEFGVEDVAYFKKTHYSSPMTDSDVDEVLGFDPGAVIEAISDCGSCNSSSVVDAIEFERRGIPTVQVITDEFVELNQNISASYGLDELPLVVVEHPTRYLDSAEIQELVDGIKWSIETMLTCEDCLSGECTIIAEDDVA